MDICKVPWWLLLLSMINEASSLCHDNHCHHACPSGKYQCLNHGHNYTNGCICYPADYCDYTHYPCSPLHCPHNEPTRCNTNNTCECYCSQDSHCQNCPEQGFCINEQCVCESNNYCPGGNQYYCLKNFHCPHDESKRCNLNDRCECFCNQDGECKNCPEKGFCVDGQCVCESHDFCPKGNHLYCMYLDRTCSAGFTAKCNGSNHCYCAYVPGTCSGHDVTKCFHLRCRTGEKKFCEGRTCTCKPLDYCENDDVDCGHMACDGSLGEISLCGIINTCQCLAIPDFCGGTDTSSCTHLTCNQYQVKICDNGICKCQLNPSCDSNLGLNHTCTSANTVLEVKYSNGTKGYENCSDDNLYPICVDGRCQCIFWKTPSPPSTTTTSTTTTISAVCTSRDNCNQGNTFMIFPGWQMPCPVDHIDCYSSACYCSPDRVTTTELPTTPTTAILILTTKTSIPTTKTSISTTKTSMSTTKTLMSTTKTSTTTKITTTEKITETTHKMPVTTDLPAKVTTIQPVSFPIHTSGKTCSILTDCIGEICPLGTHPYCRYSLTSNSCQCTECTEHSHCSCSSGLKPHCSFDFPLQTYFCQCKAIPVPDPTISGHLIGK